jgi:tetratricopeptide (TPR) repeat protein
MDKAALNNAYVALVLSLRRERRNAEAVRYGQTALKLFPSDWRIVETVGESYFYLGNYDKTLDCMRQYLSASPGGSLGASAYFFMGEVFNIRGKWRYADITYTAALQMSGGWVPYWWYRLGEVREAGGDYQNAIAAYQEAVKRNPSFKEAVNGLAHAKEKAGV